MLFKITNSELLTESSWKKSSSKAVVFKILLLKT